MWLACLHRSLGFEYLVLGVLPARMAGDRKYRKDKAIISEFDSHTKGKAILTVDVDLIPD